MFYHNALQISENSEGEAGIWTGYFFRRSKRGGEIRSKFRKIFRRWFSFIVKNYEYTKRDLHEMALCVLNEDEWIIYYIYYTYIFIQRYSDFTFVLSLSLLLALLKPMNPCHRRVRSTGTPTSANCLCCWPFGVSVKFYEESSEKLERCKHIQCMNIWFCYILLRCLQMCLVYMVTWNISSWTGFWVALKKGVLSRRISRVVSLKYSPEQIHILNLPKNWWNWVCVDVFPFPKRKHWFRSQPLLFREGDGSELNSPTSMANDPKSGTVKCGTLRCEMGECKHVCFSPPVRWGLLDFMSVSSPPSSSSPSSPSSFSSINWDPLCSVWRAGPQWQLGSSQFSVACWTPIATGILSVQCGVLDPNRDLMSSVWRAGPQPRYCEFSVACWTPTAILRVECGVLDPNRDPVSSVWRPGPQPRSCEFSVAAWTPTAILWVQCGVPDLKYCVRKFVRKNDRRYVRKNVRRYVRRNVRKICQKICQKECQKIRQKDVRKNVRRYVRKNAKRYVRKNVRRYFRKNDRRYVRRNVRRYVRRYVRTICQKICQKECQKICQKICQEKCQKDLSEGMSKDMSERMSKDMSGRMSEDKSELMSKDIQKNVKRYVRKNVRKYVSKIYVKKNARRYVRKNVRKICQKECQKICQKSCQKMCQKECQKICPKECREICQKI